MHRGPLKELDLDSRRWQEGSGFHLLPVISPPGQKHQEGRSGLLPSHALVFLGPRAGRKARLREAKYIAQGHTASLGRPGSDPVPRALPMTPGSVSGPKDAFCSWDQIPGSVSMSVSCLGLPQYWAALSQSQLLPKASPCPAYWEAQWRGRTKE